MVLTKSGNRKALSKKKKNIIFFLKNKSICFFSLKIKFSFFLKKEAEVPTHLTL